MFRNVGPGAARIRAATSCFAVLSENPCIRSPDSLGRRITWVGWSASNNPETFPHVPRDLVPVLKRIAQKTN